TGTVENYYKGVKQKDHAFFAAFAPRENPRIAIAVICENAGFGASSAAPIASLMMEQYLNDSIAGEARKAKVESISKLNLMPARIYQAIKARDSLLHAKDSIYIKEKKYLKILKDTMGIDEDEDTDAFDKLKKSKETEQFPFDSVPSKNKDKNVKQTINAIMPDKQKKHASIDSVN
ncbi:MAG: penicillin-binding transpeptidase domain-containing protein, partial [Bacteroidota bacterium]|nr:penicillin-binding transpeptidase domain-containing protein [Bacteroidota bacterium]